MNDEVEINDEYESQGRNISKAGMMMKTMKYKMTYLVNFASGTSAT